MSGIWKNNKNDKKDFGEFDSGEIFWTAYSFRDAAKRLKYASYDCEGQKGNCLVPYIVNLVFAGELFLKSILVAKRIRFDSIHNLHGLFKLIDDEAIKSEIADACHTLNDTGCVELSFIESLKDIGDAFEYWRYVYEKKNPVISISFLEDFVDAVMKEANKCKIEKA